MSLFTLVLALFATFHLPFFRRINYLGTAKRRARVALALTLVLTGILHFTSPARFVAMMPPIFPRPLLWVYLSGIAELAGAFALLAPHEGWQRRGGWWMMLVFLAIWPANIYVALSGQTIEGLSSSPWYYWLRVPFQGVYLGWVAWSAELFRSSPFPKRNTDSLVATNQQP